MRMEAAMKITRRKFVESSAVGSAAALLPRLGMGAAQRMPMRDFGKTGLKVSILAFGGGMRFLSYENDDEAIAVLNHALDLGINYIDTAHEYGDGKSQLRIGQVMKTRRKQVVLATKFGGRKADEAMRQIETDLKRLQVDQVDVLNIHGLEGDADLASIEAPDGALKSLYRARDEKMARFIGITCHASPQTLKTALERHDLDVTQMALNPGFTRIEFNPFKAVPVPSASFENLALPVAVRKNMGIIAMKIFAQDWLQGKLPAEKLLYYSMSLPVATAVIGMPRREHIEQNVALACSFKPLSEAERKRLSDSISDEHKIAMEKFFSNHIDS
jgi:aryl-alcohol dehydrogenase-like predicted oxidoreductase